MEDRGLKVTNPAVAEDIHAEEAASTDTTSTILAEVDCNVVCNGQKDADKAQKNVAWGGDNEIIDSDENEGLDPGDKILRDLANAKPEKKKKKKKKSGKKGAAAPTGFEEYYVDVPVTPEQYEEEKAIYDPSITFSERIETAIQRYVAKRKFDSERKDLFDKYMTYGGVDSGPKMFGGGLDQHTLEDSSAADIATMTATNFVDFDKHDPRSSQYVVDFDGVLKGFLSSRLPVAFNMETEQQIKSHIAVIRNFLNYLLHHDVCPEYSDQINAARDTCNLGEKQLFSVSQACRLLPGDFNKACSVIFGGQYQGTYIGDQEWTRSLDIDKGMSEDQARRIFLAGLAAHGNNEVYEKYTKHVTKKKARIVEDAATGLEIVEMECANPEILSYYNSKENPVKGLLPLGILRVKSWNNPEDPPEDLTEEEELELASKPKETKTYTFWVEDHVMSKLFVGMKFTAHVYKLSFGVWFFDTVLGAYCSFYQVLPNEKMLGWREHKYLPPREVNRPPELQLVTREEGTEEEEAPQTLSGEGEAGEHYEQGEDIIVEE
ncbi:hypothetical protein MMC11_005188 [Xylographa trunciseda]|nr:hypothetical protein [Xylographa trunciseda]